MKTISRLWLIATVLVFATPPGIFAAPFTPGNLAVLHVGDGVAPLTSAGTPVFIDEFTTAGVFVQTIPIPSAAGGPMLTLSGTATSEGALVRSPSGQFLTFAGYGAPAGTAGIAATTSAAVPREVGLMAPAGVFNVVANTAVQFSGSNIRGAVTDGANDFWAGGGNSGTFYFGFTAASATIQNGIANTRVQNIQNGNLGFSTGSGTPGIYTFAGTPKVASAPALLIGTGVGASPYGYAIRPDGLVAYVADDRNSAPGGIQRWNNVAGVWTLVYTLGTGAANVGARGLVVDWSGASPVIYATTSELLPALNRLIKITDVGAASPATTLVTVLANRAFRGVAFTPILPPIALTCSPDIIVTATGPGGAVVNYTSSATGGCPPVTVNCVPPSGSTFPIGTTTVTCTATDLCGQMVQCAFTVTVLPETEIFFPLPNLPPTNGMYIPPPLTQISFGPLGVVIRNPVHRAFTNSQPPPPPGGAQVHNFDSQVDFEVSLDGGVTFQQASGNASVAIMVQHTLEAGGISHFDTEMLQLDLTANAGGTLLKLRESPTQASTGKTTIRLVPDGHMIASFFDVFTELSLDGGASWHPAAGPPHHVRLRKDPRRSPPVPEPTPLLPPPNDHYVSPGQWHALFAQGIILRDASHNLFTQSFLPPTGGGSNVHGFGSQVDVEVSTDSGATFQSARAEASVLVGVGDTGAGLYETEMLALDLALPGGIMVRESPTRRSIGATEIQAQPDGTYRVASFFDIFTELSLDGGATWQPHTNGPVHMELRQKAPEVPEPGPTLPPPDGTYISPDDWHALYANGIIITNASHDRFTQTQPPPPPGGGALESFGSLVSGLISLDGGVSFQPFSAPANVDVMVDSHPSHDTPTTRFFDTEMLSLQLIGLPGGLMVRESPTRASLGRTSIRQADPADYRVSSFFDVFTELSVDGGMTWSPQVNRPAGVSLRTNTPVTPIVLTCSSNLTVTATSAAGAVVTYSSSAAGGCPPVVVNCNPPSGSTFPIGTTTVTCTASDACGQVAECSFTVTVNPPTPQSPEYHFPTNNLPPGDSVYISPALWHVLYANGIVIRDVRHRFFTQQQPPPPLGTTQVHVFGSQVDFEVSFDNGTTFNPASGTANVSVQVTHSMDVGGRSFFDTEMLQLDLVGPGFMLRESPTLQSTGQTTIRPAPGGGSMIGSFFDIWPEVSTDGGINWVPAQGAAHVELRKDPRTAPEATEPTSHLPPPTGGYVSPQQWHALYAQGIVIRDVSHKFFTDSQPPPPAGGSNTHAFNSQVDLEISLDGGASFQSVRVAAPVQVRVTAQGSPNSRFYDTEMLALNLTGLPGGVMLRESPTLPSRGGTVMRSSGLPPGDPDFDLLRVHSFFDIWPEISLDGGNTWSLSTNGPVRMELVPIAPEVPKPSPNLPPLDGAYISPADWHALYANGIIITNASHDRFTQSQPPPPPGGSAGENFGSTVHGLISLDGGVSFQPFSAPASVDVQLDSHSSLDTANTRFFDTEMLSLNLSGGTLPGGIMVRESPTRASLGRTSVRSTPGDYRIGSFFDVFTEISVDGGMTWLAQLNGPVSMSLRTNAPVPPIVLTCSSNRTVTASSAAGAIVYFSASASGGCPPVIVNCVPPSGSTFPIGTNTVTCTATDACGQIVTCSFTIVVKPPVGNPCLEPDDGTGTVTLPPAGCQYLSPDEVHLIIDGLPPGTTIQLSAIHKDFICQAGGGTVCSFSSANCRQAGGTLGGEKECASSTLALTLDGTGSLAGFHRQISIPIGFETHVGPRTPGQPVQSFDTDMFRLFGQITNPGSGDPDFDLLRIVAGTDFGLPSPGHTTLTRQGPPGSGFAVDSFFDITYRIDFVGKAGGALSGMSGSTTATIRMVASRPPPPPIVLTCSSNITLTASSAAGAVVNFSSSATGGCPPVTVNCVPPSGSTFPIGTNTVTCTATDACGQSTNCTFTVTVRPPVGDPCLEPDNGTGTVTLPPAGCQYLSPDEVHLIIDGLPPGTTIQLAAIHKDFICNKGGGGVGVCSFNPTNDCREAGGTLGGEKECVDSTLVLTLDGTGTLAGFHRQISVPIGFETHVGPRALGNPVQSFDTDMFRLFGQITGDPDFDLLRIVAGTDFGLPSPGHTTLTRQGPPGSDWAVDSFFDITYRIDFVGKPGSPLGGMSGSTTATIRMVAVEATVVPAIDLTCSSNRTVTATSAAGAVVNFSSSATGGCPPVTVNCVPPSGSIFPIGTTPVTCTASDACGQTTNCTFTVTVVRPTITLQVVDGQVILIWNGGTLQSADKVDGPYIDVDPQPTSPHPVSPTEARKFFRVRAGQPGFTFYDTEMLQLDIAGGGLPGSLRIRESPTLASLGKTAISPAPGGGYVIDSFFDVFTELSTDNGATWSPSLGSAPRMRFTGQAPTNSLPPFEADYVSPAQWHALYAQGIYLTNAIHRGFTANFPPPPPGGTSDTHTFSSTVNMQVRPCPTCPLQPVNAPAQVTVRVTSRP